MSYRQTKTYVSGGEFSEPLNYTQIIFEQVRAIAKTRTDNPVKYHSAVLQLKILLAPYVNSDKFKAKDNIQKLVDIRNTEFNGQSKKERDDGDFVDNWNIETAEKIFIELMMLISRCGFLPQRQIDWVLED